VAVRKPRYTRDIRLILDRGKPVIDVVRYVDERSNSNIGPHDCDRLTIHIVKLLNEHPLPRRRR
jgi:hypothetical protein